MTKDKKGKKEVMGIALDKRIADADQLQKRMSELRTELDEKEIALKQCVREIHYAFQFTNLVKSAFKQLRTDKDLRNDAIGTGLYLGANALLDNVVFRKGANLKRHLLSAGLKRLALYIISRNKNTILKQVGS